MRKISLFAAVAAFFVCAVHSAAAEAAYQTPQRAREQAAQYSKAAKEMIRSGRVTDGVKMMRLAIKTNPLDPMLRMDYVTFMSRKGEQSLKDGNRAEAIAVFRSVEEELMSAAKLFKDYGSAGNAAHALGQVGDIYRYVYGNESRARGYYAKGLELDPASTSLTAKLSQR
jgi:tetratricopeptide (TPR) repeat protein